jgi:hypothetical protein
VFLGTRQAPSCPTGRYDMRVMMVLLVLVTALGMVGCKSTTSGGEGAKVATEVAPNLEDYNVETVAVLAFANTTGDPKADEMAVYLVQSFYGRELYHFISSADFLNDATRVNMAEDHARLVRTWQKKRTIDENVVERLLAATGYDAMIAADVSKWEEVKLQANQEGTSDTTVGAGVKMYAKDGTLLWEASELQTEESVAYLPSFNTRATESGRAVTTSQGAVPDPPPIHQVAKRVAADLAKEMPAVKGGGGSS